MRTIQRRIKKATSTPKGRIIAIGILLFLVLAIGGAVLYWKIYRKQIIRDELENLVKNKSGGLYSLSYDTLLLDEAGGNLKLTGIRLVFDSLQFARLAKSDAPPTLVKLNIPSITVTGVQTPRALLNKEIVGKKLLIDKPEIDIFYTGAGKDSARYVPPNEVYRQLLGNLELIRIDTLEIAEAIIKTRNLETGKINVEFANTSVQLVEVNIDENTSTSPDRILFAKHLALLCEKISFASTDRPYNYVLDSVSLHSAGNTGSVKKFRMIPLMNENAFVKSLPTQDDRFDFTLREIHMKNLNIPQLFNENIFTDSLVIGSAVLKIYRDLSIPRDKKNRVGTYPHQQLNKLPVTVNAKKLVLKNTFVEYKEKSNITGMSGKVQFFNTYATITNVTNSEEAMQQNNIMNAEISSRFLNKTPLKATWKFYLQNPRGRFDIKGSLGSIAAKDVNSLTEPMGPAKLEDGQIRSLAFDFKGNNYGTDGSVKMLYNDLKLSLLEKEKGSKELDKKTVASFVANIVVKNDNPSKKDEPRVINLHFDRDTNRSIFHLVWKSIFKGVKETVGIKK